MYRLIKKKFYLLLAIVAILLVFLLLGCNKTRQSKPDLNTPAPKESGTVMDEEEGWLAGTAIVMAIGEEAVTGREAMFYFYQLKSRYETALGEKLWSFEIEPGKTFEEYAKEEILRHLTETKIICQEAQKQGIELSQDEKEEALSRANEYCGLIKEEDKKKYGIAVDVVKKVFENNLLADKMYNITTGVVDTNIPDEQARQVTIQYIKVLTEGTNKNGIQVSMSLEEKKTARKQAKKLLKQAKKEESFIAFADSSSDDPITEITFGKDNMPPEFGEEAMKLKSGEYSNVMEGKTGYYILYCVKDFNEEATRQKKEEIISREQDRVFEKAYTEWSKNYEVIVSTDMWDQMKLYE